MTQGRPSTIWYYASIGPNSVSQQLHTELLADSVFIGRVFWGDDGADGHSPVLTASENSAQNYTELLADSVFIGRVFWGDDGMDGAAGAMGAAGATGERGLRGFQGIQGPIGAQGPAGNARHPGFSGIAGNAGQPRGEAGHKVLKGRRALKGREGLQGRDQGASGSLQGPPGPAPTGSVEGHPVPGIGMDRSVRNTQSWFLIVIRIK